MAPKNTGEPLRSPSVQWPLLRDRAEGIVAAAEGDAVSIGFSVDVEGVGFKAGPAGTGAFLQELATDFRSHCIAIKTNRLCLHLALFFVFNFCAYVKSPSGAHNTESHYQLRVYVVPLGACNVMVLLRPS